MKVKRNSSSNRTKQHIGLLRTYFRVYSTIYSNQKERKLGVGIDRGGRTDGGGRMESFAVNPWGRQRKMKHSRLRIFR